MWCQSLTLTEECDINLDLFKLNFAQILDNFLHDLQLAYENIVQISREKLLVIQKLQDFIPKTASEFYNTYIH